MALKRYGPAELFALVKATITWKGAWESGVTYLEDDMVEKDGSTYVSKHVDNLNNPPPNTYWWELFVSKGATGDVSTPPSGNFKVTNIYVNTNGKIVVEYDDTPVA